MLLKFIKSHLPRKYCCTFSIYHSDLDKYTYHPFIVRAFNQQQARQIAIILFDDFYNGYEDFDRIDIEVI